MGTIRENLATGKRRYILGGVRVPRTAFMAIVGSYCWVHNNLG